MSLIRRPRKFLFVVDGSPECKVAIRFATRRAGDRRPRHAALRGGLSEMQQWRGVEVESLISPASKQVKELSGILCELSSQRGCPLVATVGTSNHYPIPVTIVPDNLSDHDIDNLA